MKVILLKDVRNVGKRYEIKDVSDGFALNFLIPNRSAEVARPEAIKKVEQMRIQEDLKKKQHEDALMKNLKAIEGKSVETEVKVNEKGHLFKGIHKEEVAKLLKEKINIDIAPEYIELEKPIKDAGKHMIPIKVGESMVQVSLEIKAKA
jgi:large subunit ribosomal protein L9